MNKHIGSNFEEFLAEDCTEEDRDAMRSMATIFAAKRAGNLKLILDGRDTMELPQCAVNLISDALIQLAAGNSVTLQTTPPPKIAESKIGDPKTSTSRLITYFREYYENLAHSGECIDNDCDVISKPYAKIISERLAQFQSDLQKYGQHINTPLFTCDFLLDIADCDCGWAEYSLKAHKRWGGKTPPPPSFDKQEIR